MLLPVAAWLCCMQVASDSVVVVVQLLVCLFGEHVVVLASEGVIDSAVQCANLSCA